MHVLRKSYQMLSSGTRVELVTEADGVATVRLPAISDGLATQNHPFVKEFLHNDGIFDIEADRVAKLRDRAVV